ncbi:hypothetical protein AMJ87_13800, partial [candidate division WOR_3 bacterium SM23_60]
MLQRAFPGEEIAIDYVPKGKKGDYFTNLAFRIAAKKKGEPLAVAQKLVQQIQDTMISTVTAEKPGFINISIDRGHLLNTLFTEPIVPTVGHGEHILVEYVSVNPTGPISIVNARAAAVGDTLVKIMKQVGFACTAEYYINDAGRQIQLLAESVQQRMDQLRGKAAQVPEHGYHGDYLLDVAREAIDRNLEDRDAIKSFAVGYFINHQKETLERFGVVFDNWVRESDIRQTGLVDHVLATLNEKNLTYEEEGALFFRTTGFGDDRDRVIVTSDGRHTYLLPDIAYHLHKIKRDYPRLIDIWGPDHYGHIKGLTGGIMALGYPEQTLHVLIVQEVKLKEAGEYMTMSKRAGTVATLDTLLDQVPKDVVRFFLLMRSCSQHLDFDLDLALRESEDNPVYYVQYAHARIKSIIQFAREKGESTKTDFDYRCIKEDEEIALAKAILRFPEMLEDVTRNLEPSYVTHYLIDLAHAF